MPNLACRPAAGQTVTMRARLAAAGLVRGVLRGASAPEGMGEPGSGGGPDSVRVAAARSSASERGRRQRQQMRPLAWVFIAAVVISGEQGRPAPGLAGAGLGDHRRHGCLRCGCGGGAESPLGRARSCRPGAGDRPAGRRRGGPGWLQPHGATGLAASLAVWIAAVRLPAGPAAAASAAVTAALAAVVALTQHPAAQPALAVALLCLLLAVTGQFIRRSRESQDQTELLMAQLQDARDAEAAAAALAERSRIAGELHDVLAHALSGLAIQLQGARKLADAEGASPGLRAAIGRSADLAKEGLTDARQAVGALRGDRLPTVGQLPALVADFRRDTGTDVSVVIEGDPRPLPAEADLALYRGAQEALTNIARYAPGAAAAVTIRYALGSTVVTVANSSCPPTQGAAAAAGPGPGLLAGAGGGHGLATMRERAQRVGGTARSGPRDGGWLVEVEVPA